jgi:uncharacterized protein YbjQ (UPF0145 family)
VIETAGATAMAGLRLSWRPPQSREASVVDMPVTTNPDLPGFRNVRHIALVRGVAVRSRSAPGNIFGGFQAMFGGRLSMYVRLAEAARQEATDRMIRRAAELGANAIVCMRYDATEIMDGVTEVLAYGAAVHVEPIARDPENAAPAPPAPPLQ